MRKTILALMLAVALIVTGCAGQGTEAQIEENTAAYPVTVEDQAGTEVTIQKEPERIASGYYISTSACIAMGLEGRIAAIEEKSELRPVYRLATPELIENAVNIGSAKNFDLEACIDAKPDLVILPMKAKDYAKTLNDMGIPAIVVNPESHEQLVEMIELIGKATNTEQQAEKLIDKYSEILGELSDITKDIKDEDKPVVYMAGTDSYLSTAPKDMYQGYVIEAAGGINAAGEIEGNSRIDVSYEQIASMNPDIIIIPTNNLADGPADFTKEDIMNDEMMKEVTAVKTGAIYNMPYGYEAWDSPVPSGVLGTLWLTAVIHPHLYTIEKFADDTADFYEEFYGFELKREDIAG